MGSTTTLISSAVLLFAAALAAFGVVDITPDEQASLVESLGMVAAGGLGAFGVVKGILKRVQEEKADAPPEE